ncbi:MAG TPA: ABC transporter permease [Opitutaceae bacterium]|jgi:putative ABC transport system permease protein|nr:ABC transporter permease [Opitutaceae bacterium]
MGELFQDLRIGLRSLRRSPGFATISLLTIAIGIGANAAIFSFIDSVVLKPLPYPGVDRIVRLYERLPQGNWNGISTLNFLDWQKQGKAFQYMAAIGWDGATLTGSGDPVQLGGLRVSSHYFDILGVHAALGRTFVDGEDQLGREHVVVITNSLWKSQLGGAPGIIGRTIILDGQPNQVIGVLPAGHPWDSDWPKLFRPLAFESGNMTRDFHWLSAIGRLKPGVSVDQARSQMTTIAISMAHDYPASNKGWGIVLQPFADSYVNGDTTQSLYVLMAAVGMVLLIACANLANLTLARGVSREREAAIRSALGAGRGRLLRQFLTESLLLSAIGGALGIAGAYFGIMAMKAAMPNGWINSEADPSLDRRVVLFAAVLTLITGLIFGLLPAIRASRPDLSGSMKQGGIGSSSGRSGNRLRGMLVVTEVALATILLGGAGLLIRSFVALQQVDTGFVSTNVVTASLPTPRGHYPSGEAYNSYLDLLHARLSALPGVRDVAFTSALPMQGWGYGMPFQVVGDKQIDMSNRPSCFVKMVSPGYFKAIGMKLVRGRLLSEHDVKGSTPSIVINQSMATKYFKDTDPIGRGISVQEIVFGKSQLGKEIPWQVVGVVADEKVGRLGDSNLDSPGYYVTTAQAPVDYLALVVTGSLAPEAFERSIGQAIHEVNKNQVLQDVKTLDAIKAESTRDDRLRSALLSIFAGVALVLSALGLYGVIAYSVVQRTREIGIRSALGATKGNILGLVLGSGLRLTALGLVIGIGGAIGLAHWLSSLLFNVHGYDPLTLTLVALVLLITAVAACLIPARQAVKVNPIIALKAE